MTIIGGKWVEDTRLCCVCKQPKKLTEFAASDLKRAVSQARCRQCKYLAKIRQLQNDPAARERQRQYNRDYLKRLLAADPAYYEHRRQQGREAKRKSFLKSLQGEIDKLSNNHG